MGGIEMVTTLPGSSRPASVKLELHSRDGELKEVTLIPSDSPEDQASAPARLPEDIWQNCCRWYQHLEVMWSATDNSSYEYWQRKHYDTTSEIAALMNRVLLPDQLQELLIAEMNRHRGKIMLVEIHADDDQLNHMPFELLGQPYQETGNDIVVWRRRPGSINRRPGLRLLVARSAPIDVSLPQNEEEVHKVASYVSGQKVPGIRTEVLLNCTYENFTRVAGNFRPGTIHFVMHGTLEAFQFNSPPSNDLIGYNSLARYFKRTPSVVAVVSTACFSARPANLCGRGGVCFASASVDLGLSAAIGMATKITPRAAQAFTECLYTELAEARPITEAYAQAVLAIKNMEEYDRLLWSVPVMYAKSGNVIPFPEQGYFRLLDRLQRMLQKFEDLRQQLDRLPMMSRDRRIEEARWLVLDVTGIRNDLQDLQTAELPGVPATTVWHKKLEAARTQLGWLIGEVTGSLNEGNAAEQPSSMVTVVLDDVEDLVAEHYPMAIGR
jgi:CHAT domain